MFELPEIRVGDPVGCGGVSVFPLFLDRAGGDERYLLADEALASGGVSVTETSAEGSVPELAVQNHLDRSVLFLEGEELHGAKQHRVLNTSVLVGAKTTTRLPVSCVEAGRWHHESRRFGHRGIHSHPSLRHLLKKGTSESIKRIGRHGTDQRAIWEEVRSKHRDLRTDSTTQSLHDSHAAQARRIEEVREKLAHVEGAFGMAVAVGGRLACLDLFDRPDTLRRVWNRLLSGPVLESLALAVEPTRQPAKDSVGALLERMRRGAWTKVKPPGDGQEYRCEVGTDVEASSLNLERELIHCSATVEA